MNPYVSVLMPVYNAEKFLREAIDSILSQSYTNFEFVIIDDCSTDSSAEIIHSYQDRRIRYFRNSENSGITLSLNRGIDVATGELIARMDADDISYPERLEKQVQYLTGNTDCDLVSSWVRLINEDGSQIGTDCTKSEYYFFNLVFVCWIYHPTIMFRKSAGVDAGKYRSQYSEDFDFYWHLTRQSKFVNLPTILLDYRVTAVSLSRSTRKMENDHAQEQQVRRNVEYYVPGLQITDTEMQLIRHTFQNLAGIPTNNEVISCLRKLSLITNAVLSKPNPNRDSFWIERASRHRRLYMLQYLLGKKSFISGLSLLLKLRSYRQIPRFLKMQLAGKG